MNKKELKKIRQSTGLTQKEFAKRLRVSPKLISMMEQGLRRITERTEEQILLLIQTMDTKKGVSEETPYCPFCGQDLIIKKTPGTGYKSTPHRCPSGLVEVKTRFGSKDMLARALTPIPRATIESTPRRSQPPPQLHPELK